MHHTTYIELSSKGFSDVIDITAEVTEAVKKSGIRDGLVCVFVTGSTASITTIEYESGAIDDLKEAIGRMAPENIRYSHDSRWGDGNGFSHVRAALLKPGLTVPLVEGALTLGTWQQIVFIDFDNRPRRRKIVVQAMGGR